MVLRFIDRKPGANSSFCQIFMNMERNLVESKWIEIPWSDSNWHKLDYVYRFELTGMDSNWLTLTQIDSN